MRRLRYALFVLIFSAVLLEIVLQIGAVVAGFSAGRPAEVTAREVGESLRVLCIGDSFTFGDGASNSEKSYPMQMQLLLRQRLGEDVSITNAGFPGQDSRDALTYLPEHLERVRPHVVCILIGVNDIWNRPELLENVNGGAPGSQRFKWRWRTARLVKWLLQDTKAGSWKPSRDSEFSRPTTEMLATAAEMIRPAGIELADEPGWTPSRPARISEIAQSVWERQGARDYSAAIQRLEAAEGKQPDHAYLQGLRVEMYTRVGNVDKARLWLEALRKSWESRQDADTATQLISALWIAGKADEAFAFGETAVKRFPDNPAIWRAVAPIALRHSEELAALAYRRHLETAGPLQTWMADSLSQLGVLVAKKNAKQGALLLMAGLLVHGRPDSSPLACYLSAARDRVPAKTMKMQMEAFSLDDRGRKLLATVFDQAYGDGASQWRRVLRHHLVTMESLAHASGARVVFVSYPFGGPTAEELQAAAIRTNAGFVDVSRRFERELERHAWSDLFVPDGHCKDVGYAILAEEVAQEVLRLIGR